MRKQFWEKLKADKRLFKWFFDKYVKGERQGDLVYNTIYQQARGEALTTMCDGLKAGIKEYLEAK